LNSNKIFDRLNEAQISAVSAPDGPIEVFAGAGSGKTMVIVARIVYLIQKGIDPYSILSLTFTNKAAKEMKYRINSLISSQANKCLISTFHSACALLLRPFNHLLGFNAPFTIIDDTEQLTTIRNILRDTGISSQFLTPKEIQSAINKSKREGISAAIFAGNATQNPKTMAISQVFATYEGILQSSNQLDFGSLILRFVDLMENNNDVLTHYQNRFKYILVDEYQDTNLIQNKLITLLAKNHHNIFVVGDDDQSIYSWRGADPNSFIRFQEAFPKTQIFKLEQNYRSTKNIIDASSHLIAKNTSRTTKTLWTENNKGELISAERMLDSYHEANFIADEVRNLKLNGTSYNQMAIFYRTNAQSRLLEEIFNRNNIPYRIYGGLRFFDRSEIKDLVYYLKAIQNPSNQLALERIINKPKRGIGKSTIQKISEFAKQNQTSFWQILVDGAPSIKLSSGIRKKLYDFTSFLLVFMNKVSKTKVSSLLEEIISQTEFLSFLEKSDPETFSDRFENIHELKNSIMAMEELKPLSLDDYLQTVSLQSMPEESNEERDVNQHEVVSFMTLHSAKGLEFPYVFITGVEDGLIPHYNSTYEVQSFEEERRLFYVGMTRAMKKLFLTYCMRRFEHGKYITPMPSPFLDEIPAQYFNQSEISTTSDYNSSLPSPLPSSFKEITNPICKETNNDVSSFTIGQKVIHKTFGIGRVLKRVTGHSGDKITVFFDICGEKTILPEYLSAFKQTLCGLRPLAAL